MAAIFKERKIEWRGESVTIRATMRIINEIEQTVSLAGLARKIYSGNIPLGHLATVYGCLLRGAGIRVSDDEVYASMYGAGDYDDEDLIGAAVAAMDCVFPETKQKPSKKKSK